MTKREENARAINTYGVAYSHETRVDMATHNKRWRVYKIFDGNPFEVKGFKWEGEFDNNQDASRLCDLLNADAALSALMTPSDGMVEAGIKAVNEELGLDWKLEKGSYERDLIASEVTAAFTAMIAAAKGRGE
jgi:hypothetical protein